MTVQQKLHADNMSVTKASKFDIFHMSVAESAAMMSYANRLKVGAVASRGSSILSYGYNGTLPGQSNVCEGTNPDGSTYTLDTVLHAEENLLIKMATSNESICGSTIYITHAPCVKCARMLIASNISRVIYRDVYRDPSGLKLIQQNGIDVFKFYSDYLECQNFA